MKNNFVLLLSFILILVLYKVEIISSQNKLEINSLEQKLIFADDSSKIEILLNISWGLRNSEFQKSIKYGIQAIELAQQYKDFENLTKAHSFVGVAYRNLGNYTEAFDFYFKGLNLARKHNLEEQEGYAHINIGNLYVFQNNYKDAEEYLNNALIISEKIENEVMQAYCHFNLGRAMIEKEYYSKALIHLDKSLAIRTKIDDIRGRSVCYKYIGDVYNEMKNYTLAMKNYEKTLQIAENSPDKDLLCSVCNKISNIFLSKGNNENAIVYAEKSLKTAKEIGSKLSIRNAYKTLAQIQRANGNYKIVAEYQDYIIKYNDSLYSGQLAEKMVYIEFMNKQHEYEQKLKEQTLIHNTEIHRQKLVRNYSVMLTFILIIISVVTFMFFRIKQNANAVLLSKNKQIEKQKTTLKELNATKDKFFSIIAHDLKNPFSTILGFSELLLSRHRKYDENKREKFIKSIYNSSKNTLNLLENLLTWANTQKGIINYNPEKIHINNIIADNIDLLTPNASKKDISIVNLIKDTIKVSADKEMINFIVRNLISNAIKFTPKNGEITIYNKIIENKEHKLLSIIIEDNGVGIAPEDIEKLFRIDESFTTRGTEEESGTGLGLILCKEFIEKHGGKIGVESEPGNLPDGKAGGSVFHFTIPLQ